MATNVLMPALSPTMEQGKLSKWVKKVGDAIKSGDVLAEIETDKATMEVEAVDEGTLSAILVEEGTDNVAVNTPIGVIRADGESADSAPPPPKAGQWRCFGAMSQRPARRRARCGRYRVETATPGSGGGKPVADAADHGLKGGAPMGIEPEFPADTKMVTMTVREALRDAMAEEMRRDPSIFVMGEEVAEYQGAYKVTQGLLQEFGEKRVIDTPITEHGFAGIGVGAAMSGLRPIVEFMTFNFAMQAIDHIINSAAKTLYMSGGQMGSPIVFRGPNGAAARVGAQHSQDYAAWYSSVPGLKVVSPYSAADAKGLLKSAIRDPNPVVFLENEILYGQSFEVPEIEDFVVPIGKARVARAGQGRDAGLLVDRHDARPQGRRRTRQAGDRGRGRGHQDHPSHGYRNDRGLGQKDRALRDGRGGLGSVRRRAEIMARLMEHAFDYLDAPVVRVTGKDVPMPYAANLEKLALPNVGDVVEAAKGVCYRDPMPGAGRRLLAR